MAKYDRGPSVFLTNIKHTEVLKGTRESPVACHCAICLISSSLDNSCLTWPSLTSQPPCCHLLFFLCASPFPSPYLSRFLRGTFTMPILSSQMPLASVPLHAWGNPSARMSCLLKAPSQCKILPPLGIHLSLILPTHVLMSSLLPFTTV